MGSGNSTIRPDSYESKSLKEMKEDWVDTVKSVYKFGSIEDIQLAYDNISDVCPSTLDWDFVRDWKTCKTWDQEKFMESAMKYRDGVVPSELQSILDEK